MVDPGIEMRWIWLGWLLVAVAAADFTVRWATGFDMVWVVRAEAVLFLGAGAALAVRGHRWPPEGWWPSMLHHGLVAAFALAGLRAALWALGLPVARANLVVLAVAAVLAAAALVRSRRRHSAAGRRDPTP